MTNLADSITIIDVTADNVAETGVYCIKNKKAPGYHKKVAWFQDKINNGLKIKIAVDDHDNQLGFVELIPSELAWRPVDAQNYYFIQCIVVFSKGVRNQNIGSTLLTECEQEARKDNKEGICTMTSKGPWMANEELFLKNGFVVAARIDRFELMYKSLSAKSSSPKLKDWTTSQKSFTGWNLIYSDQCPWHDKSVTDLSKAAEKNGIELKVTRLTTPQDAQNGPSGFGTYALIKDGRLLADHYISKTRFENILKKEK